MSLTEIRTDRLLLRAVERSDLLYYHRWLSDPECMKFCCDPPHTTLAETEVYLKWMISDEKNNGITEFSVCLTASSESEAEMKRAAGQGDGACSDSGGDQNGNLVVIGRAGLWDGSEMGYIFDREHWGKGYAFEALDAILKHVWGLDHDNPAEVAFADVDPENVASMRLLLKLGFVETGRKKNTYKTHIGWRDSVYFEKKRPIKGDYK